MSLLFITLIIIQVICCGKSSFVELWLNFWKIQFPFDARFAIERYFCCLDLYIYGPNWRHGDGSEIKEAQGSLYLRY